jgi:predicted RNA-binding protein (virulence factor B family)
MIELGNYNNLRIERATSVGLFLSDREGTEILLPSKYVPQDYEMGGDLEVFCYLDHMERPIATTLKPHIKRNGFAFLKVATLDRIGAFLDWGLEKHLFVPFAHQKDRMQEGESYLVHCTMDEKSGRLIGSSRLNRFLTMADTPDLEPRQKVGLLVSRSTDLGWEVIVDQKYKGLVFHDQVFQEIRIGQSLTGYVKEVRADNKLDISLQPLGADALEPHAALIVDALKASGGFLDLHDKSDPEDIKQRLGLSKKAFKRAVGTLYKNRVIRLDPDGIHLN